MAILHCPTRLFIYPQATHLPRCSLFHPEPETDIKHIFQVQPNSLTRKLINKEKETYISNIVEPLVWHICGKFLVWRPKIEPSILLCPGEHNRKTQFASFLGPSTPLPTMDLKSTVGDMSPSEMVDFLFSLTPEREGYADVPLGRNIEVFRILCKALRGNLETFPDDFIPPSHLDPNYAPPNRGIAVVAFGIASLVIATVVVILRLATKSSRAAGGRVRRVSVAGDVEGGQSRWQWEGESGWEWYKPWKKYGWRFGKLGWDDCAALISLIWLAGYTSLNVVSATHGGMGKHCYDISLNAIRFLLKTTFVHTIVYLTLSFWIKLSILLFYLNLFPTTLTNMRRAIYALIGIFIVYTIVGALVISFICKPVHAFWELELRGTPRCPSKAEVQKRYFSVLGIHVAGDVIVLMLPIRVVLGLRLPKRQKVILVCIFCAGGLACIASFLRLYYFPRINASLDVTWNVTEIALWGQVEASIAVICASIPALKPLFSSLNRKRKVNRDSASTATPDGSSGHPFMSERSTDTEQSVDRTQIDRSDASFVAGRKKVASFTSSREVSPVREKVSIAPMTSPPCGSRDSTVRGPQDYYDIDLADIDNIDIDIYLDDSAVTEEVSEPSRTVTPPERAHIYRGSSQTQEGDGDDHEFDYHEILTLTTTAKTTTLSKNTSKPGQQQHQKQMQQPQIIPPENFLRPPPPRVERLKLYPPRTQFPQSQSKPATLRTPPPASAKSRSSPRNHPLSRAPWPNTSKPLPPIPYEQFIYTKYPPPEERDSETTSATAARAAPSLLKSDQFLQIPQSQHLTPHIRSYSIATPSGCQNHLSQEAGDDRLHSLRAPVTKVGDNQWEGAETYGGWGSRDRFDLV